MENAFKSECLSSGKLEIKDKEFACDLPNVCDISDKVKSSQENKSKSLKVTSALDPFCKTSVLNESSDFMECNFKRKFKSEVNKKEILCEICKENITNFDLHNREKHVNNCIDKQISSDSEIKMPVPEAENPFILECPLCFKQFSSTELRSNHTKKCGKSKGLCLQSVIKALQLQERHALERISLGLPVKPRPVKSNKNLVQKKVIVEPKSKADSDIQLAKALSLSLATSGQEDVKVVTLKPPNEHQRPGKKTKTVQFSTPLLVLRTEEERKRLLLDKVATIVAPVSNCGEGSPPAESDTTLQMGAADELSLLWHLSSKASETSDYYVEGLTDWINPSNIEVGAKLCRLSQVPGHEIVTQLPCEYTFSSPSDRDEVFSESVGSILSASNSSASSVIKCLRLLVASSWMSDVDIHTACGTIIPAHRLLLAARCPPLKQDSNFSSGSDKKVLKWETVSFDAALQFLNFLYTGNMEVEQEMLSELSYLANKYQVSDLQVHLHSTDSLSNHPLEVESEKTTLRANEVTISSFQPDLGFLHKSQEEMNVDLDIVCDCINSSLKPSQPCGSQLCGLEAASPSKCSQKSEHVEDCEVSPETENNAYELSKTEVHDSSLSKDGCPTSPVIFDIYDSESDSSDDKNKHTKIVMNCSQKFTFGKSDQCVDVLDASSMESNKSEDSVKILKSSFTSISRSSKEFEKVEDLILSSPGSLKMSITSTHVNDFSIKSPVSCKLISSYSPEIPHLFCNVNSQTSNNANVSNNEDMDNTLNEINRESGVNENMNESHLNATQILNSARTEGIVKNNVLLFDDSFEICAKSSEAFKNNIIPSPKSYEWDNYTSPIKNTASPNILCDSASTAVERPQMESCIYKSSNSCASTDVTCSKMDGLSTLNELLSICSEERELDKMIPCTSNLDVKKLNISDSFKISISSPEPFDDPCEYLKHDVCQGNSETVSIKSPKRSREKTTNEKTTTPLGNLASKHPQFHLSDSPITPLPDYKTMLTPDIKQALRRIGVKALPRKKAIALLSHVYEEIHPLVNGETDAVSHSQIDPPKNSKNMTAKKRRFSNEEISKPSKKRQKDVFIQDASQESDNDSSSENPEWLGCVPEMSFSQFREDSPTKVNKDDIESIKKFIQSNDDLYTRVLSYKPLNMVEFHQELKDGGIKVSIQKLTDFLDEQCITFTCPRKEEFRKKQTARTQRFRKNMIAKLSQQPS